MGRNLPEIKTLDRIKLILLRVWGHKVHIFTRKKEGGKNPH